MRLIYFLSFLFICLSHSLTGQYYQYSQLNYSEQRVNPASISLDDYVKASFIYRTQQSLPDVQLNNYLLSAKYPFIKSNGGDRWSAIGLILEGDQSGLNGLLEANNLGLSYALNFPTAKREMLSIGISLNYFSRRVNSSNLSTGNQFVPGLGFDPGIDSGESLESLNTNYLSSNFGLIWQALDQDEERKIHFGLSAYNFNSPDEGLMNQGENIPVTFSLYAGYRVYQNSNISIYSETLYTFTRSTNLINAGLVTKCRLDKYDSRLAGQSIQVLTKYLSNQGVLVGFQWHKEAFSVGASYDIPINNRVANQGAFEVGLSLGTRMETKYKVKRRKLKRSRNKRLKNNRKKKNRRNTQSEGTSTNSINQKEDSEGIEGKDEDTPLSVESNNLAEDTNDEGVELNDGEESMNKSDSISTKAHIGDFEHARFNEPIYFNFNFDLDKSKLKPKDEKVLDDLLLLLKEDASIVVVIEGHTDDIGPLKYNQHLSYKRARAVASYLLVRGVEVERIDYYGYGETKPLVENSSAENRRINRRVEFVLYQRNRD
ncbi:MAG: PorP/SprF family type IX secretion system membrane protein [Bacteroidota bacterium]